MIVIASVQIQLAFQVSALIISMGAIVDEFETSPTTISTAVVVYSLCVAGFVMLGAKIGSILGSRIVFQVSVLIHGGAMAWVALSQSSAAIIQAQIIAGLAAAAAVPALVVMIAAHYRARQQEQALGILGASQAIAGVMAFLIVGFLGTAIGWRWPFAFLAILALLNVALSFRLDRIERDTSSRIDWLGALLAAASISMISLGVDNLKSWGLLVASSGAPFSVFQLSPAPILIVVGVILAQAFFVWLGKRRRAGKSTLFAVEILDGASERAATFCLLIIATLGPAINFLLPLYIQIVQGRTSLETAIAIIPYTLAIFASAIFVVRLYSVIPPKTIARFGFVTVAIGLFLFAAAINNSWSDPAVIGSLIIMGLGEGALLTLMFNVLVSGAPKSLAGHVGSLRGTVNNLSAALGTAIASLLAVGLLGFLIASAVEDNPDLPPPLISQINLDNVDFLTNDELEEFLYGLNASDTEINAAIDINEETRLQALRASVVVLSMIALLALIPAGRLPTYRAGEVSVTTDPDQSGETSFEHPEETNSGNANQLPGPQSAENEATNLEDADQP
ncbi:MAG: MFS transporter [Sphaerobacteraceae bacterium]|nr:MAG: MFS transporter [Sphaerobacteraceae bacterium]